MFRNILCSIKIFINIARSFLLSLCLFLIPVLSISYATEKAAQQPESFSQKQFLIENVNLIDINSGVIHPSVDVLVEGKLIKAIGNDLKLSKNAQRIPAQGKYLMPGLTDMHVHYLSEEHLGLNLAYGVTLIRHMWGNEQILKEAEQIEQQRILGPHLITTSPIIDGLPKVWPTSIGIDSPAQAKTLVEELKQQGYNSLKVYSKLEGETLRALSEAATENQMRVTGHVPRTIDTAQAIESGLKDIQHLTHMPGYLQRPESPYKTAKQRRILIDNSRQNLIMMKTVDSSQVDGYARLLDQYQVFSTPTLIVHKRRMLKPEQKRELLHSDEIVSINPRLKQHWQGSIHGNYSEKEYELMEDNYRLYEKTLKALSNQGADIMIGTDAPNPFVFPGFSVHEELALFVDSGLTPLQALQAATLTPARYLNRTDIGEIKPGFIADMVILEKNPLENIENTLSIYGVFTQGRYLDSKKRQEMLSAKAKR